MRDKRVVDAAKGPGQSYYMEAERRLSAAQDDIASLQDDVSAISFTMNYGYSTNGGAANTANTTFTDTGFSVSLTTEGGPVLVVVAGGAITNDNFQEQTTFAVQADSGADNEIGAFFQDITASTDDFEVPLSGVTVITGLSAGAHTFKLRFRTTAGGVARIGGGGEIGMFALELPQ